MRDETGTGSKTRPFEARSGWHSRCVEFAEQVIIQGYFAAAP